MKAYRSTLILVAVLVVLAAFVYVFEGQGDADGSAKPQEALVFDYDEQDVTSFEVRGDGKTVALAKDEEGKWQLTAPEQAEADEWSFSIVLWRVARLTADLKVADAVEDPNTYGLDQPQLAVTFKVKDGRQETLTLGNANPRGTGNYAVKAGDPALYLINTSLTTDLRKLLTTPPKLVPTPTPDASAPTTPVPSPGANP